MTFRKLFSDVQRSSSNINKEFNRVASQKFNEWLDDPGQPLCGVAYALLSNWFLTDRSTARESPRAEAALKFWRALGFTVPNNRLTDPKKDAEILASRFDIWWMKQEEYQGKGK